MKKILIVDDDEDIVDLVVNRLKKNHYDAISATDGESGIKKAVKEKPDLIIMDILMPGMQGGDAAKILKSQDITKDIPILFFTALSTFLKNSKELDTINVGGQFYPAIAKPFDPEKLLSTIKSLLEE